MGKMQIINVYRGEGVVSNYKPKKKLRFFLGYKLHYRYYEL
jgi:hypothetical protein